MAVRREVNLTTTGTLSPIVFGDLGDRQFTHPTTGFNLLDEYSYDKLVRSADLHTAINDGHIILKDESGVTINSVEILDVLNSVTNTDPTINDDADAGYSIGSNWINTITNALFVCVDNTAGAAVWIAPVVSAPLCVQFGRNHRVTNSYLIGGGVFSNQSPFILPWDARLAAISAATRTIETWSAEVHMGGSLVSGALLSITSAKKGYVSLSIDFNAGDEIQVYANGYNLLKPNVALFFERR